MWCLCLLELGGAQWSLLGNLPCGFFRIWPRLWGGRANEHIRQRVVFSALIVFCTAVCDLNARRAAACCDWNMCVSAPAGLAMVCLSPRTDDWMYVISVSNFQTVFRCIELPHIQCVLVILGSDCVGMAFVSQLH